MKFGDIHIMIYLIWIIPALLIFYLWATRIRKKVMKKFAAEKLLDKITTYYSQNIYKLKNTLTLIAVFLMIFALARPQWGFYWKENIPKGYDIIIAIDVSRSMLANDILPDRLDFVKTEVGDFAKSLKGDRIGLIAFSGNAFMQCPLTVHYNGFTLVLRSLSTGIISRGGTDIPSAIEEAIRGYRAAKTNNKILVIISDGENTEGDISKAIQHAKREKIKISCIGIGTTKGALIPVSNEGEKAKYVDDLSGEPVTSRLDEDTLKMIAMETGGTYVHATQTDFGLNSIREKEISVLEKHEFEGKKVKVYQERFQLLLALAAIFLVIELSLAGKKE